MVRSIPSLGFDIPSFEIHHSKPWTKYDSRDQSKKTTTYSRLTTFVNSLIMIDEKLYAKVKVEEVEEILSTFKKENE